MNDDEDDGRKAQPIHDAVNQLLGIPHPFVPRPPAYLVPRPTWTKKRPTLPGYYWCKCRHPRAGGRILPTILFVKCSTPAEPVVVEIAYVDNDPVPLDSPAFTMWSDIPVATPMDPTDL